MTPGLEPGEDYPFLRALGFYRDPVRVHGVIVYRYYARIDGGEVSLKWLRSLVRLSRIDREIDRKKRAAREKTRHHPSGLAPPK